MPDNVGYTAGSGTNIAAREVTYSGDLTKLQTVALANVTGADDATTARDISDANPLQTQEISGATSLLQRILAVLLSPVGYDRSLGRQRSTAVIESGTVTTVSTVTTVTTCATVTTVTGLTNIDGRNGSMLINAENAIAWAQVHRARIT